ncbi:helix-turn-helix domain-containing protein [Salmonirosea aquatica]|uniref:Helix-turn-helix domain-containing protein n=1 Tax=Salmonirosea aquatica TaxID=2654236 RepID=A0A7C9FZD8_9BACT|nr:helix-turn-helix domain-containing protein [Cytophagaceae bacterium SJW1-29]
MKNEIFSPPRHLQSFIKRYIRHQVSHEERCLIFPAGRLCLPDLTTGMAIHLAHKRHWRIRPDGAVMDQPLFNARGYYKEPIVYNTDTGVDILAIEFTPLGMSAAFGEACEELNNYTVDAGQFFPSEIARLEDVLLSEAETAVKVSSLNHFFTELIRPKAEVRRAANLLGAVENYRGLLSVRDLARELCMCERTLNRFFHEYVGLSPKLYLRLSRYRRALEQIKSQEDKSWSEISYQHQYYDQAHFINEIKKFTGKTPSEIRNAPGLLL